eukprot:TRINITY_DN2427_c0_g1_i1.p1 TRINITY_DN2427_c0_g1~~TRINITY_DN2427_c0_g1_i1.p1  ORF type:complete len:2107 (-),score=538.20 TRINITY_DN2427_c0_g1_i1:68-6388(-)
MTEPVATASTDAQAVQAATTIQAAFKGHLVRQKQQQVSVPSSECTVRVFVRVRPFDDREVAEYKGRGAGLQPTMDVHDTTITLLDPEASFQPTGGRASCFQFTRCFWSVLPSQFPNENSAFADQEVVYREAGRPMLDRLLEGFNGCIFAYGQTGSGKTYSMMGDIQNSPGVIPRFCMDLFSEIEKSRSAMLGGITVSYTVRVSYVEIYMEKLCDLLADDDIADLKIVGGAEGPRILGLETKVVESWQEILAVLRTGDSRRHTRAHKLNAHSSRSHAVFQVALERVENFGVVAGRQKNVQHTSVVNLIDLAGSENTKRAGVEGVAMDEAKAINLSLTTLRGVIDDLSKSGTSVQFRNSILTRLLQGSLGGNCMTTMLAAVSPAADNFKETTSTLTYTCKARKIINRIKPRSIADSSPSLALEILEKQRLAQLAESEAERERLKQELAEMQNAHDLMQRLHQQQVSQAEERNKIFDTEKQQLEDQHRREMADLVHKFSSLLAENESIKAEQQQIKTRARVDSLRFNVREQHMKTQLSKLEEKQNQERRERTDESERLQAEVQRTSAQLHALQSAANMTAAEMDARLREKDSELRELKAKLAAAEENQKPLEPTPCVECAAHVTRETDLQMALALKEKEIEENRTKFEEQFAKLEEKCRHLEAAPTEARGVDSGRVVELEAELALSKQLAASVQEVLDATQRRLAELENDQASAVHSLETLRDFEEKCLKLEAEVEIQAAEKGANEARTQAALDMLAVLEKENTLLKQQYDLLHEEHRAYVEVSEASLAALKETSPGVSEPEKVISHLEAERDVAQAQIHILAEQLAALKTEHETLTKERTGAPSQEEVEALRQEVETLRKSLAEVQNGSAAQSGDHQAQLVAAEESISGLKKQLGAAHAESQTAEEQLANLQVQLEAAKGELTQLKTELETKNVLLGDLEVLKAELAKANGDLQALLKEKESLAQEGGNSPAIGEIEALKAELDGAKAELQSLQSEKATLVTDRDSRVPALEIESLRAEIETWKGEYVVLQSEKELIEKDRDSRVPASDLEALKEEISKASSALQALQAEKESIVSERATAVSAHDEGLRTELEQAMRVAAETKALLETATGHLSESEKVQEGLRTRLEETTAEKSALSEQLAALREQVEARVQELDTRPSQDEIDRAKHEIQSSASIIESLQLEVRALTESLASLQSQTDAISQDRDSRIPVETFAALNAELSQLKDRSRELETKLEAAEKQNAYLQEEITSLQSQAGTHTEAQSQRSTQLQADLEAEKARASQAQDAVTKLEEQVATLRAKNSELESAGQTGNQELTQARQRLAQLEEGIKSAEEAKATAEEEAKRLHVEIEAAATKYTQLEGDLQHLKQSLLENEKHKNTETELQKSKEEQTSRECERLQARLAETEHALSSATTKGAAAAEEVEQLGKRLQEKESALAESQQQVKQLELQAQGHQAAIASLSQEGSRCLEQTAKEYRAENEALSTKLAQLQQEFQSVHADLGKERERSAELMRQVATAKGQETAAATAAETAQKLLLESQSKLQEANLRIAELEGAISAAKEATGDNSSVAQMYKSLLSEKTKVVESLNAELAALRLKSGLIEQEAADFSALIKDQEHQLEQKTARVAELEARLAASGTQSDANPFRALLEEKGKALEGLQAQLAVAVQRGDFVSKEVESLQQVLHEREQALQSRAVQLATLEAEVAEYRTGQSVATSRTRELESKIQALGELQPALQAARERALRDATQLETLAAQLAEKESVLSNYQRRVTEMESALSSTNDGKARIAELEHHLQDSALKYTEELENLRQKCEEKELSLAEAARLLAAARIELDSAQAQSRALPSEKQLPIPAENGGEEVLLALQNEFEAYKLKADKEIKRLTADKEIALRRLEEAIERSEKEFDLHKQLLAQREAALAESANRISKLEGAAKEAPGSPLCAAECIALLEKKDARITNLERQLSDGGSPTAAEPRIRKLAETLEFVEHEQRRLAQETQATTLSLVETQTTLAEEILRRKKVEELLWKECNHSAALQSEIDALRRGSPRSAGLSSPSLIAAGWNSSPALLPNEPRRSASPPRALTLEVGNPQPTQLLERFGSW